MRSYSSVEIRYKGPWLGQGSGTYDFCLLLLDELPEFGSRLIEVLRQPLEGQPREVSISRASGTITFPANFMLIAAQNPCPCGYYGDNSQTCTCSNSMITACEPSWAEAHQRAAHGPH